MDIPTKPASWSALKELIEKLPADSMKEAIVQKLMHAPDQQVYDFLQHCTTLAMAHQKVQNSVVDTVDITVAYYITQRTTDIDHYRVSNDCIESFGLFGSYALAKAKVDELNESNKKRWDEWQKDVNKSSVRAQQQWLALDEQGLADGACPNIHTPIPWEANDECGDNYYFVSDMPLKQILKGLTTDKPFIP